jgi:dTMP kinase
MYHKKKKNKMILKNFIALEGLDGAGTTTQANLLYTRCQAEARPALLTREPTESPAGLLVRKILRKEAEVLPRTMARLFAADRNEHVEAPGGIRETAGKGVFVISDRYLFSSLAYQSVDCGWDFVRSLNEDFPLPEALVFLDIQPREGEERLKNRREREIYEYESFQTRAAAGYARVLKEYAGSGIKILRLEATEKPWALHEKIWELVTHGIVTH